MAIIKGKYIVTAKFNKEITGTEQGLVLLQGNIPAVIEPAVAKDITWKDLYTRFILEAGVPKRVQGPSGDPYHVNIYSEVGMKAFRKAIEKEKVEYPKLVASTKLYYAGSVPYKVAIGRYMSEGMWRTGYDEFEQSLNSGTLNEHIKQSTNESYSRWKT
jgi:hypothetical protein